MNNEQIFKEKAQSLTAKQIVETIIDAIKNPVIKLDFDTYGELRDGVCYGCAATNVVCKLSGVVFDVDSINLWSKQAKLLGIDFEFLGDFEFAINWLRKGNINRYNDFAKRIGIAQIKKPDFKLPYLTNENYLENLHYYEKLAEFQEN